MASTAAYNLWDNHRYSIANFNFNLTVIRLQELNILSRKQTKCCWKLARLNNITFASRNLFSVCVCVCVWHCDTAGIYGLNTFIFREILPACAKQYLTSAWCLNDPRKSRLHRSSTDQFMQFCGSVPIKYRARRKRGAARVLIACW